MALVMATMLLGSSARAHGPRKVPDLRRAPAALGAPQKLHIPLTIHVVIEHGAPVVDPTTIARWVARSNAILAEHGVEIGVRSIRTLQDGPSDVTRWRHRRALAREAPRDGSLHVFLVRSVELGPSRRADRRVRGIYWRYHGLARGLARREYVVVGREAPMTTLVHEIGHVLGLRHATQVDNVMCSCRRGPELGFSATQGRTLRAGARRFGRRQALGLGLHPARTGRPLP
jgi:hypothetical protein